MPSDVANLSIEEKEGPSKRKGESSTNGAREKREMIPRAEKALLPERRAIRMLLKPPLFSAKTGQRHQGADRNIGKKEKKRKQPPEKEATVLHQQLEYRRPKRQKAGVMKRKKKSRARFLGGSPLEKRLRPCSAVGKTTRGFPKSILLSTPKATLETPT